jgi:hypothetical protein
MKPHPRIRKTIKWGGLALGLLLAGVWVRSQWVGDAYIVSGCQWGYDRGLLVFERYKKTGPPDGYCTILTDSDTPRWRNLGWIDNASFTHRTVPIWILLAPTLLATAAAWRLDALARRRARTGVCPKCGYDRAGLAASAVCPECGTDAAGVGNRDSRIG